MTSWEIWPAPGKPGDHKEGDHKGRPCSGSVIGRPHTRAVFVGATLVVALRATACGSAGGHKVRPYSRDDVGAALVTALLRYSRNSVGATLVVAPDGRPLDGKCEGTSSIPEVLKRPPHPLPPYPLREGRQEYSLDPESGLRVGYLKEKKSANASFSRLPLSLAGVENDLMHYKNRRRLRGNEPITAIAILVDRRPSRATTRVAPTTSPL
jgi:hypothetical protein